MNVKNAIDVQGHVVFGNGDLGSDFDHLLAKVVHVCHFINNGDLEVETWLKLSIKLFESVD